MQLTPPLERQPLVRGVADQRVPEAERARHVGIALDELREPVPGLGGGGDGRVALEDLGDERTRERDAEHRRPSQERAVSRSELVDARRDQGFDRVGQLLGVLRLLAHAGELSEEERVPGRRAP